MESLLTPWLLWFVAGVALALFELAVPGFILIFFGVGCLVVSGVLLVVDLTVTEQVWLFVAATIISLLALRRYAMRVFAGAQDVNPEDQLIEQPQGTGKVVDPISPNAPGRVAYRGSFWDAVSSVALQPDTMVRVCGYAENSRTILKVEPLNSGEN
ncbi:MAG: NfeD family protein [Desulfuromonas sp.]|jgi:membrane protein implicated in regulation of membrane protease activity|nr:MAG: NfeD family protein [Desulfuromonas sp.]